MHNPKQYKNTCQLFSHTTPSSMKPIVDRVHRSVYGLRICANYQIIKYLITIPLLSARRILLKQNYLHWAFFSTWTAWTWTYADITNCWITIREIMFRMYITLTPSIRPWFRTSLVIYAVFLTLTRRQFLQKIQHGENT